MIIEELRTYFKEQLDEGIINDFSYQLLTESSETDNGIVYLTHHDILESFLPFAETFQFVQKINNGTKIIPRFRVNHPPSE